MTGLFAPIKEMKIAWACYELNLGGGERRSDGPDGEIPGDLAQADDLR
jgi:hypothetical protein